MAQKYYTKTIINTIIAQLGGELFIAMTGVKLLYMVNKRMFPVLICKLPKDIKIKNNIDIVTITYNIGIDLYEYAFINSNGGNDIIIKTISDVYAEDLISFFEEETGLLCW